MGDIKTADPGTGSPGIPPPGASYPNLAGITSPAPVKPLDLSIQHAIGLNWFHSILGPDERTTPWMAEGFNTYYDRRYKNIHYPPGSPEPPPLRLPTPTQKSQLRNIPPPAKKASHPISLSKKSNTPPNTSRQTPSA